VEGVIVRAWIDGGTFGEAVVGVRDEEARLTDGTVTHDDQLNRLGGHCLYLFFFFLHDLSLARSLVDSIDFG
jgi:hypothetical protein